MTQLTEYHVIAITELVFYTPFLVIAIVLASRNGFKKSAGWLYLILFSIIRLLGAILELGTISSPNNLSLLSGANALRSSGLSPLILVNLGLLTRVRDGLNAKTWTLLDPRVLRLIQIVVMLGLILSIVGSSKLGNAAGAITAKPPVDTDALAALETPSESRAGVALMLAGFALVIVALALLSLQLQSIAHGERRLLLAVAAAAPFILVRAIYAALSTYTHSSQNFRWFVAGPHYVAYLVGMCVSVEISAVAVIEAVGLTVHPAKSDKNPKSDIALGRYTLASHPQEDLEGENYLRNTSAR